MSKLKPCPCCGNKKPNVTDGTYIQIECYNCGIQTPNYMANDVNGIEEITDDWNTRESNWTPISNCPQKKGAYWCYVDDDSLVIKYWVKMFDFDYGWNDCNVTHWMPLPTPPQGA